MLPIKKWQRKISQSHSWKRQRQRLKFHIVFNIIMNVTSAKVNNMAKMAKKKRWCQQNKAKTMGLLMHLLLLWLDLQQTCHCADYTPLMTDCFFKLLCRSYGTYEPRRTSLLFFGCRKVSAKSKYCNIITALNKKLTI